MMFYTFKSAPVPYFMDVFLIGSKLLAINSRGRYTVHLLQCCLGWHNWFCYFTANMYSLCDREPGANWQDPCPQRPNARQASQMVSLQWPQPSSSPKLPLVWCHDWIRKASHLVGSTLFKTHLTLSKPTLMGCGSPQGQLLSSCIFRGSSIEEG